MSANRVTVIIVAVAAVAIVALLTLRGGGDDDSQPEADSPPTAVAEREQPADEPRVTEVPENPDDVRGSDPIALTRPENLRRALAELDKRRQSVEGVFDGLRVAPGRIDTIIVHPDDRRTNLQIRADFSVPFESTHDFPTQADFRRGGLSAREVDVQAPARLLKAIDEQRNGSAEHDVDYVVIRKGLIDNQVGVTAYMRIRTPRPRYFDWRDGQAVPIG